MQPYFVAVYLSSRLLRSAIFRYSVARVTSGSWIEPFFQPTSVFLYLQNTEVTHHTEEPDPDEFWTWLHMIDASLLCRPPVQLTSGWDGNDPRCPTPATCYHFPNSHLSFAAQDKLIVLVCHCGCLLQADCAHMDLGRITLCLRATGFSSLLSSKSLRKTCLSLSYLSCQALFAEVLSNFSVKAFSCTVILASLVGSFYTGYG